jgi:hypothetical protein
MAPDVITVATALRMVERGGEFHFAHFSLLLRIFELPS